MEDNFKLDKEQLSHVDQIVDLILWNYTSKSMSEFNELVVYDNSFVFLLVSYDRIGSCCWDSIASS